MMHMYKRVDFTREHAKCNARRLAITEDMRRLRFWQFRARRKLEVDLLICDAEDRCWMRALYGRDYDREAAKEHTANGGAE